MHHRIVVHGALLAFLLCPFTGAELRNLPTKEPLWEPLKDEVYLQEVSSAIATSTPLTSVEVYRDKVYAGAENGLFEVVGTELRPVSAIEGAILRLRVFTDQIWAATSARAEHEFGWNKVVVGDQLWIATSAGLWRNDDRGWIKVAAGKVLDMCLFRDEVVFLSENQLFRVTKTGPEPLTQQGHATLLGVTPYAGTLYVHDGKRIGLLQNGEISFDYIADWGHLEPGVTTRDIFGRGSRLYVATNEGLGVLRGMTWYMSRGEDGLCYEDTTCIVPGFDNDLWIGTMRGAIRNVGEEYQFFGHARWIPHDQVNAIASGDKVVYIATNGGLGIITYEPYTLAKKAAYYERWLEEWGQKRLGFVHSINLVNGEWLREVSDNDVGFSSHYVSAKCFEYAVTGSKQARAEAVDMMKSVKWSEEITGIEGFPARSIYNVGETTLKAMHGSGGLPAEWHATPDGIWEWKGDTSSDETDAHVYETTNFLNLVANEEEKKWATEHLHRVVGHIVDNGFVLRDVDGQPTRWARWDPEYLQTPYGYYARGLNGMEAFNYVTTAYHFTRDPKFMEGKQKLLGWNYLPDILRQKLTFHPGFFTHFDDRLAFYSYYPLIQHETDPELKTLWLRSLERSWEVKRIEGLPWFNFIYGALTGNDCENERAVAHLREWPLDLHKISYTNSHRDDLYTPKGYTMYSERVKPLSPRETEPDRWDGNWMRLDGGNAGAVVAEPGGWLDAYWMGRFYGFITAPQTDDKELTTVPHRGLQLGAKPYAGPPRPKLQHERN